MAVNNYQLEEILLPDFATQAPETDLSAPFTVYNLKIDSQIVPQNSNFYCCKLCVCVFFLIHRFIVYFHEITHTHTHVHCLKLTKNSFVIWAIFLNYNSYGFKSIK